MRRSSAYRVFLTCNSEYHIRDHVCFGVRDRRSGHWLVGHPALRQRLAGTFVGNDGKPRTVATPVIGESLRFDVQGASLATSPILSVEEREGVDTSLGGDDSSGVEAMRVARHREDPARRTQ